MKTVHEVLEEIKEVKRVQKIVDEKDFGKLNGIDGARVSTFLWRYIKYLEGLKVAVPDKEDDG